VVYKYELYPTAFDIDAVARKVARHSRKLENGVTILSSLQQFDVFPRLPTENPNSVTKRQSMKSELETNDFTGI
jgi:hypothetical protein